MIRKIVSVRNIFFKLVLAGILLSANNLFAQVIKPEPDVSVCPSGDCFCSIVCDNGHGWGYTRNYTDKDGNCTKTKDDNDYADVICTNKNKGVREVKCRKVPIPNPPEINNQLPSINSGAIG